MKFPLPMFVLLLAAIESRMYKSMMTIPKFKKVWDKTKDSRSHHFRVLVDSLASDLQKN
jgi:hypothetical protein